jgi:SpoVK/Ycf46/Vps4 family AAA+-type ATPase
MFRKENNSFILDLKECKTIYKTGTPEERVKMLNEASEKNLGIAYRGDIVQIDTEEIAEKADLEAGIYRHLQATYSTPEMLSQQVIKERNYPHFPEIFNELDTELTWFRNNPDFFSNIGIRRSRSVLLWGPPGFSKTAKIHDTVLKNKDALILFFNDGVPSTDMVVALNECPLDKIIIFEEFATNVNNDRKIADMLNFLDGDNSLDNAFFIITTNHPEVIPRNVLRPSRVDKFIKVDKLSTLDIKHFLGYYLRREITEEEINSMKTQSLANLREICISSLKENLSLPEAINVLKKREKLLASDFANERKLGLLSEDY